MVTVAQSAELWIVAPAVVGSSPIGHPFFMPPYATPAITWSVSFADVA